MYSYLFLAFLSMVLLSCSSSHSKVKIEQLVEANHPLIQYIGRFDKRNATAPRFAWSGSEIRFRFEGRGIGIYLENTAMGKEPSGDDMSAQYRIQIDEQDPFVLKLDPEQKYYQLADNLEEGEHDFQLFRRTEASSGITTFKGILLEKGASLRKSPPRPDRSIEFIGDSFTAGFGILTDDPDCLFTCDTEDYFETYSAVTARELEADHHAICYSGKGIYQNYDLSQEATMRDLYKLYFPQEPGLKWEAGDWQADMIVISLGTNDFSHHNPDPLEFIKAYSGLIQDIRARDKEVWIICLTGCMMADVDPRKPLATLKGYLIKVLEEVGDERILSFDLSTQGDLGFGCAWHPTLAQQHVNARELVHFIKENTDW